MKTKKILSLLLSVVSLNLSANFINCFSMGPYDYSVTEVAVPGFTNCPKCGAQRPAKLKENGYFSTKCPHCGCESARLIYRRRKIRNKQYIYKTSDLNACKFCGSQRKNCKTKGKADSNNTYQCTNCWKCGKESSLCIPYNKQIWKRTFCKCKSRSGLILDSRTLIRKDAITNQEIPKVQTIKSIICDPNGFDYYCYNCQKVKHITLTKEQAERVCTEYDRCLSSRALPSFRSMDMFLDFLPK